MGTAKRKHERGTQKEVDQSHPNTTWIEWIGDREDLGLVKGTKYTYTALGKTCDVAPSTMRGRLNGNKKASDRHMWRKGEKKSKEEWTSTVITRFDTESQQFSQKYLSMKL